MVNVNPMLCKALTRDGDRCQHRPMRGQLVCHMHGGKAPQNLAKAEERLRALVHPAINALAQMIESADQDSVRLNASKYVLELAGFKATVEVKGEHEVVIRVIDEPQPIVIEQAYELNGRAHS
jgi:hypothetical protein